MAEKKEPSKVQTKTKVQAHKEQAKKETKVIKEAEELDSVQEQVASPAGNFVYIGKKGAMAYVLAVATQFGMGAKEVIVKARGKSISRAVDVAEIVRNQEPSIKVVSINISTEEMVTMEGRPLKVSSIEIILKK